MVHAGNYREYTTPLICRGVGVSGGLAHVPRDGVSAYGSACVSVSGIRGVSGGKSVFLTGSVPYFRRRMIKFAVYIVVLVY